MTTPKIDPRFPDRPSHPDFWGLVAAVNHVDGLAEAGLTVEDIMILAGIDSESLFYMARQRALRMFTEAPHDTAEEIKASIVATWIDGLMAGQKYAQNQNQPRVTLDESIDGNRRQK